MDHQRKKELAEEAGSGRFGQGGTVAAIGHGTAGAKAVSKR